MEEEKSYRNKDLFQDKKDFDKAVTNDFIGDDFIEQLEWGMLMVKNNFKQIRFADYLPMITANTFDKAFLMSAGLNDNVKFFSPLTDLQATPDIFPLINVKHMIIGETITLGKVKELDLLTKRNLKVKRKYAFEYSYAFFKKDTETFYGKKDGYELNNSFFQMLKKEKIEISDLPKPISLHPQYVVPEDAIKYLTVDEIATTTKQLSMAYQIALSMFYEWSIYLREPETIGFTIPIEPHMLKDLFDTSMLKFENKKRMLHFVKDHYRRKIANPNEDYSVYVNRYLRGEHKFDYRGFYAEIIPPKYDLNRAKTKKKFIDATS